MVRTRGYKSWIAHNKSVLEEGIKLHVKKEIQPDLVNYLKGVAKHVVAAIDGGVYPIPIYTGNLHDATGVGVYVDGMMATFMPTKVAIKSRPREPLLQAKAAPISLAQHFLLKVCERHPLLSLKVCGS